MTLSSAPRISRAAFEVLEKALEAVKDNASSDPWPQWPQWPSGSSPSLENLVLADMRERELKKALRAMRTAPAATPTPTPTATPTPSLDEIDKLDTASVRQAYNEFLLELWSSAFSSEKDSTSARTYFGEDLSDDVDSTPKSDIPARDHREFYGSGLYVKPHYG